MYKKPYNQFPIPPLVDAPESITGNFTLSPQAEIPLKNDNLQPESDGVNHPSTMQIGTISDENEVFGEPIPDAQTTVANAEPFAGTDESEEADADKQVELKKITEISVDGNGVFDRFMKATRAQLQREYEQEKIDKAEFTKIYYTIMPEMMTRAIEYVKIEADAQLVAQQLAELKLTGKIDRDLKLAQMGQISAEIKKILRETAEMEANGLVARKKTNAEIENIEINSKKIAQEIEEMRSMGAIARTEKKVTIAALKESAKKTIQEVDEMRYNGAVQRANTKEQTMKLEAEKLLTIQEAYKTIAEKEISQIQIAELKANGEAERKLKASQIQVQEQQASLYERQRIGFDDKRKVDTLKTVLDTYAVVASEVDTSPHVPSVLGATGVNAMIVDAMTDVGIVASTNTRVAHREERTDEDGKTYWVDPESTLEYYKGPIGQWDDDMLSTPIDNSQNPNPTW